MAETIKLTFNILDFCSDFCLCTKSALSCVVGCSILYNCVTFSGRRSTDHVDIIFKIPVSATVSLPVHVPCFIFKPDFSKSFTPFDNLNFFYSIPFAFTLETYIWYQTHFHNFYSNISCSISVCSLNMGTWISSRQNSYSC